MLYVQLKKEVANSSNKLTVVIVSLSAISSLMTGDSIVVSMPRISMVGLDGISRQETKRETGSKRSKLVTIWLLGDHLKLLSVHTTDLCGLPSISTLSVMDFKTPTPLRLEWLKPHMA